MTAHTAERISDLPSLPERPATAHKGTFGRVLIIGGSRGMSGAAALSGLGALRGGAGLVYVAVPTSVLPIVASIEPSFLTVALAEDESGHISEDSHLHLASLIPDHSVVAIGPGLGQSEGLANLVRKLYSAVSLPMVVDADALNALARNKSILDRAGGPRILTPHPGEFARLIASDTATVQNNREELAADFARKHQVVLVLKGQGTVVTDGRRLAVNSTGNSGMATGGTGDVLTGLIASLVAQGMQAFDAAQLGVYLHGLAGDLAAAELTKPGLIASDLPRYLPFAWAKLYESGR